MTAGPFERVKPTQEQTEDLEELGRSFREIEWTIKQHSPEGRYRSLAMTYLEIAAMFASKAVTHT